MRQGFIGMDVGTGSVRGILVDEDGRVQATREEAHTTSFPRPLWAEQDPDAWGQGALRVLRALGEDSRSLGLPVAGIGLTGQMHGAVVLDEQDRPVRPAIIWMDQRSAALAEVLNAEIERRGLAHIPGNPALPNFTASKLYWIAREEPQLFARIAHFMLPKDYVRLVLTGEHATDVTDASGTLLLDIERRSWSAELRQLVGLAETAMPTVYESAQVTGTLRPEVASTTGLPAGIPVAGGAGDQLAGSLGAGTGDGQALMLSLGTSGVLLGAVRTAPHPREGRLHAMCHARPGMWVWMGVTQAAGGSYKWLHERVFPDQDYAALDRLAAKVDPGADGVVFLPYLMGERSPVLDPRARGAFVGMTASHDRRHLARAVLEGVAYSMRHVLEQAVADGAKVGPIHATGGGARSDLWLSIVSAVLSAPVHRVTSPEGPAYGAAMLAAQAAGREDTLTWPTVGEAAVPPAEWGPRYAAVYPIYKELYEDLRATFAHWV